MNELSDEDITLAANELGATSGTKPITTNDKELPTDDEITLMSQDLDKEIAWAAPRNYDFNTKKSSYTDIPLSALDTFALSFANPQDPSQLPVISGFLAHRGYENKIVDIDGRPSIQMLDKDKKASYVLPLDEYASINKTIADVAGMYLGGRAGGGANNKTFTSMIKSNIKDAAAQAAGATVGDSIRLMIGDVIGVHETIKNKDAKYIESLSAPAWLGEKVAGHVEKVSKDIPANLLMAAGGKGIEGIIGTSKVLASVPYTMVKGALGNENAKLITKNIVDVAKTNPNALPAYLDEASKYVGADIKNTVLSISSKISGTAKTALKEYWNMSPAKAIKHALFGGEKTELATLEEVAKNLEKKALGYEQAKNEVASLVTREAAETVEKQQAGRLLSREFEVPKIVEGEIGYSGVVKRTSERYGEQLGAIKGKIDMKEIRQHSAMADELEAAAKESGVIPDAGALYNANIDRGNVSKEYADSVISTINKLRNGMPNEQLIAESKALGESLLSTLKGEGKKEITATVDNFNNKIKSTLDDAIGTVSPEIRELNQWYYKAGVAIHDAQTALVGNGAEKVIQSVLTGTDTQFAKQVFGAVKRDINDPKVNKILAGIEKRSEELLKLKQQIIKESTGEAPEVGRSIFFSPEKVMAQEVKKISTAQKFIQMQKENAQEMQNAVALLTPGLGKTGWLIRSTMLAVGGGASIAAMSQPAALALTVVGLSTSPKFNMLIQQSMRAGVRYSAGAAPYVIPALTKNIDEKISKGIKEKTKIPISGLLKTREEVATQIQRKVGLTK